MIRPQRPPHAGQTPTRAELGHATPVVLWLGNQDRSQVYFERRPALDASRLALIQVSLWLVGTVILTIVVAAIHLGYTAADPVAGIASLMLLAAMLLFAYFVFRPAISVVPAATGRMMPAE